MRKHLFICAFFTLNLSFVNAQTINTVVGNGVATFAGDGGQATAASLYTPDGLTIDGSGVMYITDARNSRIRMVNSSGVISTFAGNGNVGYAGDGGQATAAEINYPLELVTDSHNNLYIADRYNNCIRMVNTNGIITTIAGNGMAGFNGDGGQATAAELDEVAGVGLDAIGNIYICEHGNNRLRKVNTSGIISTFAGTGAAGFSGDGGPATAADLNVPNQMTVDANGNVYFSDASNERVRMVNTLGIISTVAGNGVAASTGDGGQATAAEINNPASLIVDRYGDLYIGEYLGNRIRVVNGSGVISTLGGTGVAGFSGDGGLATAAKIDNPDGMTIDSHGYIYFGDEANNRIREISGDPLQMNSLTAEQGFGINLYPNPSDGKITIDFSKSLSSDNLIEIFNLMGEKVYSEHLQSSSNLCKLDFTKEANGVYIARITNEKQVQVIKLIKQ
jgi:sugar lactone lactonase YvrE